MKQQANLIRAGQVIEHEGRRWTVLKQQIITPGKGGAFIQVEMRDLKSGNKTNERWRTADTVERLTTDEKDYTYSYTDGDNIVLMDPETFEQTHIPLALLGDAAPFLQDNMTGHRRPGGGRAGRHPPAADRGAGGGGGRSGGEGPDRRLRPTSRPGCPTASRPGPAVHRDRASGSW